MNDSHDEKLGSMATFLLVIPGFALIGVGDGLALSAPVPWTLIGLGASLVTWGLVVALHRR